MNNGAKGTMPYHLWKHEVELQAIHLGADREGMKFHAVRLMKMYDAGEPVWMAVDSYVQFANGYAINKQVEADRSFFADAVHQAKRMVWL